MSKNEAEKLVDELLHQQSLTWYYSEICGTHGTAEKIKEAEEERDTLREKIINLLVK